MTELLPCPFCGHDGTILHYEMDGHLPRCTRCSGMVEKWFSTEGEAIASWNHRAVPPPEPLTLEQMESMGGDPVYIVELASHCGRWRILDESIPVDNDAQDVNVGEGDCYATYDYGKTWLAYTTKPREE